MASEKATKICVIGAGPSGLMSLYRFLQLGEHCPEIVCYEKQSTWGGQWNRTWRTGTDEYGEVIHSGVYSNLWTNVPKETMEIPEYTFEEKFGRPTPSFVSTPVIRSYLKGLMQKCPASPEDYIQYNTVVRDVQYDSDSDNFSVKVAHLPTGQSENKSFSHVIVANGIFSMPFVPNFEGIETFPGIVLHSHSVKNTEVFRYQRVLLIGSMYSAEDLAMQCEKHGAKSCIIAYRNHNRNFDWPASVEERPMVTRFTNKTVTFKDGTTAEIDLVIICTGYVYHLPFLHDNLRIEEKQTSLYPNHLYKGILWLKGGNKKLFYVGYQTTVYSIPMFDVQAAWIVEYVTKKSSSDMKQKTHNSSRPKPGRRYNSDVYNATVDEMYKEVGTNLEKMKTVMSEDEAVDFMTEYSQQIADDVGYNIDFHAYCRILKATLSSKAKHVMTFKDDQFTSPNTEVKSKKPTVPWAKRFTDSLEDFLK